MVKLMRPLLVLGAMVFANANDEAACAVDGAKSMNDLADAGIFIWAAKQRCGTAGNTAACEVDIAEATEKVNEMINVIVGALNDCGAIKTAHVKCGMAVGELTAATAGLAAASGGIVTSCPNTGYSGGNPNAGLGSKTSLGKCLIDAKSSMAGIFSASSKLSEGHTGEAGALNLVSAFADLGSALAASVNDCSAFNGAGNADAKCASHALGLVSALHHVAHAGVRISQECKVDDSRLYLEKDATASTSSMPLALAALIPISAVLSFVAGTRFAKGRSQEHQQVRDFEAAELLEE